MARPYKQMPGKTYHIMYHGDIATVECTYLCPYCRKDTSAEFTVESDAFDSLEKGFFFEPFRCKLCNKITDVRFLKSCQV